MKRKHLTAYTELSPDPGKDSTLYVLIAEDQKYYYFKNFDDALYASRFMPSKEIREFTYTKNYKLEIIFKDELPF